MIGINMGHCVYQREMRQPNDASQVLDEAFDSNKDLDLLVVVLPGKTPFYGKVNSNMKSK